jgi:Rrf2 family protein
MTLLLPLSRGCQNSVLAAAFLAGGTKGMVYARREISRQTGIPTSFLSQILQSLTRAGFLRAHRGARRGYSLSRPADKISVLEIIAVYDGPLDSRTCLLDQRKLCPGDRTCLVHQKRRQIQNELVKTLGEVKLSHMAKRLAFQNKKNEITQNPKEEL